MGSREDLRRLSLEEPWLLGSHRSGEDLRSCPWSIAVKRGQGTPPEGVGNKSKNIRRTGHRRDTTGATGRKSKSSSRTRIPNTPHTRGTFHAHGFARTTRHARDGHGTRNTIARLVDNFLPTSDVLSVVRLTMRQTDRVTSPSVWHGVQRCFTSSLCPLNMQKMQPAPRMRSNLKLSGDENNRRRSGIEHVKSAPTMKPSPTNCRVRTLNLMWTRLLTKSPRVSS